MRRTLGDLLDLVRDVNEATTIVFDAVDELNDSTCETVKRLSQEVEAAFINPPPNNRK